MFTAALGAKGIAHKRTWLYAPKTKGTAERFIQSSIRDRACAKPLNT